MSLVIDKINDFINRLKSFTAFDITTSLRNDGERVEHHDVKDEVHYFHNNGMDYSYERKLVTVGGKKAFLYYHITADIDEYEPVKATYKKDSFSRPSTTSSVSSTTNSRNKQPKNDILNNAKVRLDGRLNIPMILIKKAGLKNKNIKIAVKNDCIVVTNLNTQTSNDYTTYSLSPQIDGTVILPKKYLTSNKKYFKISLKDDNIYVR